MAFATDTQRRWFFALLAGGMRRIAGKMRDYELDKGRGIPRGPSVFEVTGAGLAAVSAKSREYHPENIGKLTRAQAVQNLMAGKSSGVEASKKRKQNALRRAKYHMMKDLYGHRTKSGGWE